MNEDRLKELALLNSIGALDGDDLEDFQSSRRAAPAASQDNAAENNLTGLIGLTPQSPQKLPAGLKPKLMKLIRQRPRSKTPSPRPDFFSLRGNEGEWKSHAVPGVRFKQLSA